MVAKKPTPATASTTSRRRPVPPVIAVDPAPIGAPGPARDLSPAASAGEPKREPQQPQTRPEPRSSPVVVEVYHGDITALYADVAVVGRYKGIGARGAAARFDERFGGWLSSAFQLGMVGSELGELFYVPITRPELTQAAAAKVAPPPQAFLWEHAPAGVLVAGLGEPGRFNREGLRYLLTNVTLAVATLGYGKISLWPLGFSRKEIILENVLRGILEGIGEALARFEAGSYPSLVLRMIHPKREIAEQMLDGFQKIGEHGVEGLVLSIHDKLTPQIGELKVGDGKTAKRNEQRLPRLDEADSELERTTRITIACAGDNLDSRGGGKTKWQRFQYSALAESAVIPVREQLVQSYFVSRLPQRLCSATFAEQEIYGKLLASYMIPEDFRKFIEEMNPLTLVLDSQTALYPWEMAALKGYRGTAFFGIDLMVSRQFRTLLSATPGIPPPVNRSLKMLIIADPAADLPCPGARAEAMAVLDTLHRVRDCWNRQNKRQLDLEVTLRIGPPDMPAADLQRFKEAVLRANGGTVVNEGAKHCDPVDLLALLLTKHFDVVHYAGHGIFDPESQRMGWVFGKENCVLSAAEIFCVRHVPRLVFANACWSSAIASPSAAAEPSDQREREQQRQLQVGLAEAFFARGIQNYIGAGWPVDDRDAAIFAQRFYESALGLPAADTSDEAPLHIATLGESLARARKELFRDQRPTWGAYQHYGQAGARLLARDGEEEES
jgi:hypothetical protein